MKEERENFFENNLSAFKCPPQGSTSMEKGPKVAKMDGCSIKALSLRGPCAR
ncbi:hypothetical protein POX_b02209 [Penicillium oxalicum]|uniref:hypothetical protein n=1 Tax=Penicillium oxalicum TaxID=69781 RepID=UPI0020B695E5|nr:hypothetical protein POX_b02209 [Penicillium oxalicum]KAI2792172.1 hypothetical protein POX_b02209 [Penicillium oxalicum]